MIRKATDPTSKKDYLSDKQEMMAYALSFVDHAKNEYSKKDILDMLRTDICSDRLYNDMKDNLSDKDFRKVDWIYLSIFGWYEK